MIYYQAMENNSVVTKMEVVITVTCRGAKAAYRKAGTVQGSAPKSFGTLDEAKSFITAQCSGPAYSNLVWVEETPYDAKTETYGVLVGNFTITKGVN